MIGFITGISLICLVVKFKALLCPNLPEAKAPVDFTNFQESEFVDFLLYYHKVGEASNISLSFGSNHLRFTGNFGNITLDGNSNYIFGDRLIKNYYNCDKIYLYHKSLNKFWGEQATDFEMILKCRKTGETSELLNKNLLNVVFLSVPIVKLNNGKTPEGLLALLIEFVKKNKDLSSKIILPSSFVISSDVLNNKSNNIDTKLYFFNAENVVECKAKTITWVLINKFVTISEENAELLARWFNGKNIVNKIKDEYHWTFNKLKNTLKIKRNFFINRNYIEFEKSLLDTLKQKENLATYLKAISKILFIVMIIILYD